MAVSNQAMRAVGTLGETPKAWSTMDEDAERFGLSIEDASLDRDTNLR